MKMYLVYALLLTLPAATNAETIKITKTRSNGKWAALSIQLLDPDGNSLQEFRLGTKEETGPGPWFGREAPLPTRASRTDARWNWDRLSPGTYDIRFHSENSSWIVSTRLVSGDRKEIQLRLPGTTFVKGKLEDASGPVRGAMISGLSRSLQGEDRLFLKSWAKTDDQGKYRFALLPSGEGTVDAQVFLDDENPRVLELQGGSGASRYAPGKHFRGEEIWSHTMASGDPIIFDAGSARIRLCESTIEITGDPLAGRKAWIFVKSRPDFDYRFKSRPHSSKRIWRTFRQAGIPGSSQKITGLPEGEVLLVLNQGQEEGEVHHAAIYRILHLVPGKTTRWDIPSPAGSGSLRVNLNGPEYGGEEAYARIKRTIVLLPESLLKESSLELAEAFEYSLPWKAEEVLIDQVVPGAYLTWMGRFPWFDTTHLPADHAVALPLDLLYQSLVKKISGEKTTPDHAEFEIHGEENRNLRFSIHRTR